MLLACILPLKLAKLFQLSLQRKVIFYFTLRVTRDINYTKCDLRTATHSARKWIVNCASASYRWQRRSLTSDIERIYCGVHRTYCKFVFTCRDRHPRNLLDYTYIRLFIFPRLPTQVKKSPLDDGSDDFSKINFPTRSSQSLFCHKQIFANAMSYSPSPPLLSSDRKRPAISRPPPPFVPVLPSRRCTLLR